MRVDAGMTSIDAHDLMHVMQNNLSAGMIVAGWDARDGGSVYALPLGGTLVKVPFSIGAPVDVPIECPPTG